MNQTMVRPGLLRLITRLNIGGPAQQALILTRRLADDYDTVLAAGTPAASEGELSHPEVQVQRLPLVRPMNATADARSVSAVRSLLVHRRPALLHTHMAKAGTVGRLAAISLRDRPRSVHTFHGHVLHGYFGRAQRRAFLETERWLARHTDVLIAVSPEIRDDLLSLGIGRPSQYRVVSLGLGLGPFLDSASPSGGLRTKLGVTNGTPLLGVIGRLVPIKDHLTLLRAMTRLPGVHLAVIGDGELRSQLEDVTVQMGLAERVHFTGWCADMPATMSDLDVVVLTSQNEGTPVALIEAAAGGRPVVATDVGGVRSVVADGVTGLIAPAGDAEAVSAHVARLLGDARLRVAMGRAGRSRVRERFGEERLLTDIRALYAELLGSGGGRPSR